MNFATTIPALASNAAMITVVPPPADTPAPPRTARLARTAGLQVTGVRHRHLHCDPVTRETPSGPQLSRHALDQGHGILTGQGGDVEQLERFRIHGDVIRPREPLLPGERLDVHGIFVKPEPGQRHDRRRHCPRQYPKVKRRKPSEGHQPIQLPQQGLHSPEMHGERRLAKHDLHSPTGPVQQLLAFDPFRDQRLDALRRGTGEDGPPGNSE